MAKKKTAMRGGGMMKKTAMRGGGMAKKKAPVKAMRGGGGAKKEIFVMKRLESLVGKIMLLMNCVELGQERPEMPLSEEIRLLRHAG